LRILQDQIGCDKFLDLSDQDVLQNCDPLDFVDELDYLAARDEDNLAVDEQTLRGEDLPFAEYSQIIKQTSWCGSLDTSTL